MRISKIVYHIILLLSSPEKIFLQGRQGLIKY